MSINFLSNVNITQGNAPVVAIQSDQFGLRQLHCPAFAAHTGNAAAYGTVVTWSAVEFDTKNNFSAATGRFTASIAGHYFFKYHQLVYNPAGGETRVNIRVNGAGQIGRSILYKTTAGTYTTIQIEAKLNIQVGDYVDIWIEGTPQAMAADAQWSFFQGYRI